MNCFYLLQNISWTEYKATATLVDALAASYHNLEEEGIMVWPRDTQISLPRTSPRACCKRETESKAKQRLLQSSEAGPPSRHPGPVTARRRTTMKGLSDVSSVDTVGTKD